MALPATGGTWAQVLQPNLNPLNVRYWQITHVLVRDYDPTGAWNVASPSVGLSTNGIYTANGFSSQNLFTPFAANNTSIRQDLLFNSSGTNQGLYDVGLCKEDAQDWTPEQTVTQTPTAQFIRTVRNVLTKLDDMISFTPLESSPLTDALKYEWPLANGIASLGTPQYIAARGNTDQLVDRFVCMIGLDGNNNLVARVFPRVVSNKKGKNALGRKEPDSQQLDYDIEPDPFSGFSMYVVRAGNAWLGAGDFNFETYVPTVTPVTGLKANAVVPTPIDLTSITYTAQLQTTAGGSWTAATVGTSPGPSTSGGWTTVPITGLTASQTYNSLQITATGTFNGQSGTVITGPPSAPFTATAS